MLLLCCVVGNFGGVIWMFSLLMYQCLVDGIGEQGYYCVFFGEGVDELFWGYLCYFEFWCWCDVLELWCFVVVWFGEYWCKVVLLVELVG